MEACTLMRGSILIDDPFPETYIKKEFATQALKDAAATLNVPKTLARMKDDIAYSDAIISVVSLCIWYLSPLTCHPR
jgi:hypothetical protein